MTKKFWTRLAIALTALLVAGAIIYYYFPRIWGDILYPLEYEGYIVKYAQEHNLDPTLVAAVIYTESHFKKDSISRKGARGLMQIMPATGQTISQRVGDQGFIADKLFDPETNIKYGCWYLRYLLNNYPGNQNAALAAYNGGGVIGDRYVVSREAAIPIETSGFIKKVNFAQGIYGKLYPDRLNADLSEENIAEMMKIQQEKKETWTEKIVGNIKSIFQNK